MSRQSVVKRLWEKRVIRFACVGVINTLTDITILNTLVFAFGLKVLVANTISATISIVISYFWNYAIVFRREHKLSLKMFAKFVIVTGLSIVVVQSVIIYAVEHVLTINSIQAVVNLSHAQAKFIQVNSAKALAVLMGMVWNFALYQLVVFKKAPAGTGDLDDEGVVPY